MTVTHPAACCLVSKLSKEQSDWELTAGQAASGVVLRTQKYQTFNTTLKSVIRKYIYPRINFLIKAVSYSLEILININKKIYCHVTRSLLFLSNIL